MTRRRTPSCWRMRAAATAARRAAAARLHLYRHARALPDVRPGDQPLPRPPLWCSAPTTRKAAASSMARGCSTRPPAITGRRSSAACARARRRRCCGISSSRAAARWRDNSRPTKACRAEGAKRIPPSRLATIPRPPNMTDMKHSDFRSIYRHGFVRVAACTIRGALADPAANARAILSSARTATGRGVASRCFPNSACPPTRSAICCMQDGAAGRGGSRPSPPGRRLDASCCRCCWSARRCATAARLYNCAIAIHRGRLLGVVPKVHLPNYREFYEHAAFRVGRAAWWAARSRRRPDGAVRHRSVVRRGRRAAASSCMPRSARISGCRSRPARGGCAGGRDGAGQPLGQQHHHRQGGDAAAAVPVAVGALPRRLPLRRRRGRREHHRSRLGRPGVDLRERRALAETERFPAGRQFAIADMDLDLLRQERTRRAVSRTTAATAPPA